VTTNDQDLTTGELVTRASAQISRLVRDELALARAEMAEKGKRAGVGAGLFGGATIFALYGVGLSFALIVVLLDRVWPLWLAVLVVTAVVFAIAGVLALTGKTQFKRAVPPVPSEAVESVAADVDAVKAAVRDGRAS
jgi:uncharacterized membrane protein YqjE